MCKIVSNFLIIYFSFFIFSLSAQEITPQRTIKVLFYSAPPWHYLDKVTKQPAGIAIELSKQVFNSLNISAEYEFQPWPRAWETIKANKADAVLSVSKNNQRLHDLTFSTESLWNSEYVLFSHKKSHDKYQPGSLDIAKQKNVTIGIMNGASYNNDFWIQFPYKDNSTSYSSSKRNYHQNLYGSSKQERLFKMLAYERIQLVICDKVVGNNIVKQLNFSEKIIALDNTIFIRKYPIAFVKSSFKFNSELLKKRFDERLQAYKKSGKYKKIIDAWLNQNVMSNH